MLEPEVYSNNSGCLPVLLFVLTELAILGLVMVYF